MRYNFCVKTRLHDLCSLELTNTVLSCTRDLEYIAERRTMMTKFYKTLTHEHVHLNCVVIDDVLPIFLDYLSSYSGILKEIEW